jgi:hypothetical protein
VEVSFVSNVGDYFPFLNRENQLTELWRRIELQFQWEQSHRIKPDSYKYVGAQFTVCCGASGIGKTTFATDGLYRLAKELDATTEPVQLLKDCTERRLTFRLSFLDQPLLPVENQNASVVVPYRVLCQYLNPTKTPATYTNFLSIYYPKFREALTLKVVCDFIASMGGKQKQLVIVHIDETQILGVKDGNQSEKDGLFSKIVECLWSARIYCTSTTVFPILSGTNALDLYSRFASSNFRYQSLDLPLLRKSHMVAIAQSITSAKSKSTLNTDSKLAKVMHIATEGHPRLQRAFLSVGSSLFETNQKIPENSLAQPFFCNGYSMLLEKQDNPEEVWKIVEKTSAEVEKDQFPEQQKILSAGCKLIQSYLIV